MKGMGIIPCRLERRLLFFLPFTFFLLEAVRFDRFEWILPQARLYQSLSKEYMAGRLLVDGPGSLERNSLVDEEAACHRQQGKDSGQRQSGFVVLLFRH